MQIWVVLILSHLVYADAANVLPERRTAIPLRCRYPCWWIYCLGFAILTRSSLNSSFNQAVRWACCVRIRILC